MSKRTFTKFAPHLTLAAGGLGIVATTLFWDLPLARAGGAIVFAGAWATFGWITLKSTRAATSARTLRRDLEMYDNKNSQRTDRIDNSIAIAREKGSRHEYIMEQSLARLEAKLGQFSALGHRSPHHSNTQLDILFITSNGAGLGHLTRLFSISRYLKAEHRVEFLTLSRAYKTLSEYGKTVHYFPSADTTGAPLRQWNQQFTRYLSGFIQDHTPKTVVFDGTWVYRGVTEVCRELGITLVWVQRGTWKLEADRASTQRHNAISVVDEVIIPGDYAVKEDVHVGPEIEPKKVGPITLLTRDDILDARSAKKALNLTENRNYVLVNLGGGTVGELQEVKRYVCDAIMNLGVNWQPVLIKSPLSTTQPDAGPNTIPAVHAYPVAKYLKAFDFVVSAAGYNSVQEYATLSIPSVLIPNEHTVTDDQVARAEGAAEGGWALCARTPAEIREAIGLISNSRIRNQLYMSLDQLPSANGAKETARWLESIVGRSDWPSGIDSIGP